MSFYSIKDPVRYEGPSSTNPLAFRWYNPEQKVLGKTMRDHFRFAVCYWHTLCWQGTDPLWRRNFQPPMAPCGRPHAGRPPQD